MKPKYKVLDLFAGAGGLSCGFERNGSFDVRVAIENNIQAQNTYKKNFPDVTMLDDITEFSDFQAFREKYGEFDVIIGGPPCQGFSNANRHKSREINLNNLLVKKYVDFIINLRPRVFVMENVKNIISDKKLFLLNSSEIENEKLYSASADYFVEMVGLSTNQVEYLLGDGSSVLTSGILQLKTDVKEFERKRNCTADVLKAYLFDKLADMDFELSVLQSYIDDYELPEKGNSVLYDVVNSLSVIYEFNNHRTFIDSIKEENGIVLVCTKAVKVIDYITLQLSASYDLDYRIYNTAQFGVPQTRERFVMIGVDRSSGLEMIPLKPVYTDVNEYKTVRYAISDLEKYKPAFNVSDESCIITASLSKKHDVYRCRDSKTISNHCCTKSTPLALKRFSMIAEGCNFHSLPESEKSSYADPSRTQNTVYRRLSYDMPCPTVTNVRKSMWIHPVLNRAISIREAARLQSFPDSFIFVGNKDRQYQQIGNAVPPIFAEKIADTICSILEKIR